VQTVKKLHYEEYDTTAIVTAHLTQGEDTVYIEFGGILGHVRAITSAMLLLNHRKRDSGITLDGSKIHLERSGHYRVFMHKAPERKRYGITTKAVILHEQFTSLAETKGAFCILLPADYDFSQPPLHFFERLRLAIDVPISVEWTEWLWQKAQEKKYKYGYNLIRITRGYNIASAVIYTDTASWLGLVREQLDLKCIMRPTNPAGYISDDGEWEIREVSHNQFSVFHNGEQTTVERKRANGTVENVPFVSYLRDMTKHAKDNLGIVFTLEK
jgi:hypothetical protein